MVEHVTENHGVGGSIPSLATTFLSKGPPLPWAERLATESWQPQNQAPALVASLGRRRLGHASGAACRNVVPHRGLAASATIRRGEQLRQGMDVGCQFEPGNWGDQALPRARGPQLGGVCLGRGRRWLPRRRRSSATAPAQQRHGRWPGCATGRPPTWRAACRPGAPGRMAACRAGGGDRRFPPSVAGSALSWRVSTLSVSRPTAWRGRIAQHVQWMS